MIVCGMYPSLVDPQGTYPSILVMVPEKHLQIFKKRILFYFSFSSRYIYLSIYLSILKHCHE